MSLRTYAGLVIGYGCLLGAVFGVLLSLGYAGSVLINGVSASAITGVVFGVTITFCCWLTGKFVLRSVDGTIPTLNTPVNYVSNAYRGGPGGPG